MSQIQGGIIAYFLLQPSSASGLSGLHMDVRAIVIHRPIRRHTHKTLCQHCNARDATVIFVLL